MDWLRTAAASRPEAPAVITPEHSYTYADLDRAADSVADIVAHSNLGDAAVAFWGERDLATVAAVWGIPRAGATAVAIDPALAPAESMRLTGLAGARGLWAMPPDGIDGLLRPSSPRREGGGGGSHPGTPGENPHYIVFTSGSDGPRKGVILTAANIAAAVTASQERLGNGPDDSWLAVLPLFHIGGLSILWRQAAQAAPVVLEAAFDPVRTASLLPSVAFVSVVPTMLRRVLAVGARGGGALRGVLVGGGPVDADLMREAITAGIPALQTYGMTETCSQVATVAPGDATRDLGTAGRPLRGAEVAIRSDGRIQVRGAMVSPGYLGESPHDDEWFVTGDRGSWDESGRLIVHGRSDAVIVSGGENVTPAIVEQELRAIPGVVDTRVFGEPDPEWGRRVVAEVVLAGTTIEEVAMLARARLAPAEVPREWRVVGAVTAKLD